MTGELWLPLGPDSRVGDSAPKEREPRDVDASCFALPAESGSSFVSGINLECGGEGCSGGRVHEGPFASGKVDAPISGEALVP